MRPGCRFLCALALIAGAVPPADAEDRSTDVNVVTAIDMSDSVSHGATHQELTALAAALRSPEFAGAIGRGARGRIGFMVFGWFQRRFPAVVDWRTIGSPAEARAAADAVEAFDFRAVEVSYRQSERFPIGRLTDLSGALDHGRGLLSAAPFAGDRGVLNVIGNGADNFGEEVDPAQARILDAGFTVNAVVTDDDRELLRYFRRRVSGGWGSFTLVARPGADLTAAMERKLEWDISAAR